jgi:hypothetical protein
MFFRIFDKLFELLLGNIQILDKIFNVNEKTFCVLKYEALQKLEKFITEECTSVIDNYYLIILINYLGGVFFYWIRVLT